MMPRRSIRLPLRRLRPAFTLIEALMASGILFIVVVAVTSAITSGQQHAYEAHQRIAGAMAAEEMLGRLSTLAYDDLSSWDGYTEAPGEMTDMTGAGLPDTYSMIGRQVTVTTSLETIGTTGVRLRGRTVSVDASNAEGRVVATVVRFIPEPPSPP